MAIGLDDVKKVKVQRNKKKTSKTVSKKTSTSTKKKTKPWEKVDTKTNSKSKTTDKDAFKAKKTSRKKPHTSSETPPISLDEIIKWGKQVKIYPELEIPVPDFLLTKK